MTSDPGGWRFKYNQLRDAVMGGHMAGDNGFDHILQTALSQRKASGKDLPPVAVKQAIRDVLTRAIDNLDPEYRSLDSFIQFMKDEERHEYSHEELAALSFRTRLRIQLIRKTLESHGLKLAARPNEKPVRGFTTSNNDRWYGPGACRTHGGAGIEPTTGRANAKGTV